MAFIKKWFFAFLDLLFYGNFWIALCSTVLVLQTKQLLYGSWEIGWLEGFVFASTLFLYALHRISGLRQMATFADKGRFLVITRFKHHKCGEAPSRHRALDGSGADRRG